MTPRPLLHIVILSGLSLLAPSSTTLAKEPAKSSVGTRVPTGAKTPRAAAELFFKAYQAHDGKAAAEVAGDGPVKELLATRGAGKNPTLQLIDDTHIYYEGGSLEMRIVKNAAGRWYVKSLTATAD
jgi:hypothetical protein